MAVGVQFFGIDSVLDAAKNFKCAAWAIFIRSSLFMKYEGDDMSDSIAMLEQCLTSLEPSGTDAVYTIKFFEPVDNKPIKINEKSVCTAGSFNFKLTDPAMREQQRLGYAAQSTGLLNQVNQRIDKLEELFVRFMEQTEPEPEEEPETVGTVLIDALKNPDHLMSLINAGKMLLGIPIQQQAQPHVIGTINQPAAQQPVEYDEQMIARLQTAVNTLEQNDPKLVEHLEKLAAMSVNDKGTFQFLLSMLDKK